MTKHTIRDILPPDNRPPRRRPVTSDVAERRPMPDAASPSVERPMESPTERPVERRVAPDQTKPNYPNIPSRSSRGFKAHYLYYGGGAVLGIIIISVLFSMVFGGAKVTVQPKQESLTVAGVFNAVGSSPKSGELAYEIMTLEKLLTATVPATGSEDAEEKASGQITIYNEFNESPQRLIRNTRFESPDGLIYRIDKSVVVPGQTEDNGEKVPGSIEVTVYADEPGENYNTGITDFTIPGFKGSPQFEGFFARSKTPMAGGFVGKRLMVEDSVLEGERAKLQAQLEQELRAEIDGEQPDGFVSFPQGIFVEFTSNPLDEKGEEVQINEKAVLYNVLFNSDALAQHLAANTLGTFDGGTVRFLEGVDLTMSPIAPEDGSAIEPWKTNMLEFSLNGSADIVWEFDETSLKNDLSGRNKEAITTILSGYSSIEEAEVVIRPFWKGSFPEDIEDIKVETILVK